MNRIAAILLTTLLLGGCLGSGQTQNSNSNLPPPTTDAQARMRQQANATETILEGAVVGAAAGALVPVILKQFNVDLGDNASLIGAGIGAGVGALAGNYVAQKQKEYANAEDQLDSVITDARAKNQQARDLVGTMQTVLDEHKRQLARLRAGVRRGTSTQAELDKELASVRTDQQVMQRAVDGTKKNRDILSQARNSIGQKASTPQERSRVATLDGEIGQLSGRIDTMSSIVTNLSKPI